VHGKLAGIVVALSTVPPAQFNASQARQHAPTARRALPKGDGFNQLTREMADLITAHTSRTCISKVQNSLKRFELRRGRPARSTPVVRHAFRQCRAPWVVGTAPQNLAAIVADDIAWTLRPIASHGQRPPADRMPADAMGEKREPSRRRCEP
jgi:hypothetical protein